ncbi:hypothetical protein K432DRAFT_377653 [Lepidopterella palustris CBS 459.81]|uniref:Uncharacterized protein n=1 Tax=Lepidopterella palustris CBS 459.81 TaxID=1314670 RepID=A0A8E2JK47_9PEZI|nr:hypothetical protein K432DRAFT_377653 [Lepidopterella palustris CBS 459.81]
MPRSSSSSRRKPPILGQAHNLSRMSLAPRPGLPAQPHPHPPNSKSSVAHDATETCSSVAVRLAAALSALEPTYTTAPDVPALLATTLAEAEYSRKRLCGTAPPLIILDTPPAVSLLKYDWACTRVS